MKFRKLAAVIAAASVASAMAVSASAFTAGLGYQTGAYGFRNNPGQDSGIWWDEGEEAEYETWNVQDADITADGQYTVSFEASMDDGSTNWNFLHLYFMTNAEEYPNLQVTIDSFKIDGKEFEAAKNSPLYEGADHLRSDDYSNKDFDLIKNPYIVSFYNTYHSKDKDGNEIADVISSSDFGNKVEVTFTVSGLGGAEDNAPTTDAADNQPVAGDTTQSTDDKNSPDTGVEGVAVVAGIAVIAAGAIVVAKKRK